MMMNYHKFKEVVFPIPNGMPDIILLLKKINTASGPWQATIELVNVLFIISIRKADS